MQATATVLRQRAAQAPASITPIPLLVCDGAATSKVTRLRPYRLLDRGPTISAVLPAYNEEAMIADTVRHVAGVLGGLVDDFEIVVADDGSQDGTSAVLAKLQAQEPALRVRVVTHATNQGYDAALASGFEAARGVLIFFTDGDGQFDVSELGSFVAALDDDIDLVMGWRRRRADPPLRLFNAWAWKLLVNGLFGYTARDVDCAFKLFRREVWEQISVRSRGATFSAEFLVKARQSGFRVKELPVSHFPRVAGSATGARPSVIARAFIELVQLRLTLDQDSAPQEHRHRTLRRRSHVG